MCSTDAGVMNERKGPDDGTTDPDDLPDGSGTSTDEDHTTEGGDDDQFQG
jgi:hypothetical protein